MYAIVTTDAVKGGQRDVARLHLPVCGPIPRSPDHPLLVERRLGIPTWNMFFQYHERFGIPPPVRAVVVVVVTLIMVTIANSCSSWIVYCCYQ